MSLVKVGDAYALPVRVGLDPGDHAVGAYLHSVLEGVWDVGDQRGSLCAHLAPLQAEPAVDAVGSVAERAVGYPDGADPHFYPQALGAIPCALRARADRMWAVRVAVRISPGPELSGDWQFTFESFVVRLQIRVADRPIGTDTVARPHLEIRRMESRCVTGVVDHRAADPAARVVLAELDRILASDDPLLCPVEQVRSGLVGDPVLVGIPERSGFQHQHAPATTRQALSKGRTASPGADDQHVNRVISLEAAHALAPWNPATVPIEQERRVVLRRPQRTFERDSELRFHSRPRSGTSLTGSTANSGGASQCSRCPGPRRAYPRG